jgi:GNAT superfamily N-acetyltransferase
MVTAIENTLNIRPARHSEAIDLAAIWHSAFSGVTDAHGFPRDFSSEEEVVGLMEHVLHLPNAYSAIAESFGGIVGGGFLWVNEEVAGIGPVFVRPEAQGNQTGRSVMEDLIQRSEEVGQRSVRLTQASFNLVSMSLYAKLGFEIKEPLVVMEGAPLGIRIPGFEVRPATMVDAEAMDAMCRRCHGHTRLSEIQHAIEDGTARVAISSGRIVGYATDTGFLGHAVADVNEALFALLGAAQEFSLSGVMVPTRNSELLQWCLRSGMRARSPWNLMSRGWYQEPTTPFMPSALF